MESYMKPLTKINPKSFVPRIPGSKSYTNRALILAAQKKGMTQIIGALHSEDTIYLAEALNQFGGIEVSKTEEGFLVNRSADLLEAPKEELDFGAGGTPARLMLGFAVSAEGSSIITGNKRLCERPMGHLLEAFEKMGVEYECLGTPNCLPVRITGGAVKPQTWFIDASISSQFVTSLLLLATQQEHEPTTINVINHLVSEPYVDITLDMMQAYGLRAERKSLSQFVVYPGQINKEKMIIEADASAMSYFLALAPLTKSRVRIPNISLTSTQGDVGLARAFERMGCRLESGDDYILLDGTDAKLRGIEIDMEKMPDVAMTLAVVASLAKSPTYITNIANLRVKECDRIAATATELQRLGVHVDEGADSLRIYPSKELMPAFIHTYDDHRIAMSFGLFKLLQHGIQIEDPDCVAKSFPNFWQELARFASHHQ